MEANRKLQAGGSSLDSSLLQTQIDTLQWQLKQVCSILFLLKYLY